MATLRETRQVQDEIEILERECRELRNRLYSAPLEIAWRDSLLAVKAELERLIEEEEDDV